MKWQGRRQSDNMEDRRGMSNGGKSLVGGGIIGIIILLVNIFGGENAQMITPVLEQFNNQSQSAPTEQRDLTPSEIEEGKFVKTILADNEDVWNKIFQENMRYPLAKYAKIRYYIQALFCMNSRIMLNDVKNTIIWRHSDYDRR